MVDGSDASGLEEGADYLFGSESDEGEGGPEPGLANLFCGIIASGGTEAEGFGECDDSNEGAQSIPVFAELLSEEIEGVMSLIFGVGEIIDWFVEWATEHESPDAVGDGSFEAAVIGMSDPGGESGASAAVLREPFGMKGHGGLYDAGCFGVISGVSDSEFSGRLVVGCRVGNTTKSDVNVSEPCGESFEVMLFPFGIKEVIMALGAVDALSEEGANSATGEFVFVDVFIFHAGDGDEVGGGFVGPKSFGGDEFSGNSAP